jgi:hypothetical protein
MDDAAQKPFEHMIALAYDDRLEKHHYSNLIDYQSWIHGLYARSRTNFKIVFDEILELQMSTPDLTEITVIFFTDGEDTCNEKN